MKYTNRQQIENNSTLKLRDIIEAEQNLEPMKVINEITVSFEMYDALLSSAKDDVKPKDRKVIKLVGYNEACDEINQKLSNLEK